jgi:O-antigen ligase
MSLAAGIGVPGTSRQARTAPVALVRHAWWPYLAASVALAPVVVPGGPGQTAIVDALNLAALAAFGAAAALGGAPVAAPLLGAAIVIALGSALATWGAVSVMAAAMTLVQDFYLYAWFVLVANLVRTPDGVLRLARVWVWSAVALSAQGIVLALGPGGPGVLGLLAAKGQRISGAFYNPNMFADYLVSSLFMLLGVGNSMSRPVRVGAAAVMLLALVSTKSNGGLIALGSGLAAWSVASLAIRRLPMRQMIAGGCALACLALMAGWLVGEWRVGARDLEAFSSHTFLGRMEHSSQSRRHIWDTLGQNFIRAPLGIGPGNSSAMTLRVGEGERPGSLQGKEAHSDYLAFLVERGPLGLVGLLMLVVGMFVALVPAWRLARGWPAAWSGGPAFVPAVGAALVASSVHSTVIEKLHFRHFWMLAALAVACGRGCASLLAVARAADADTGTAGARGPA